ncbi:MFS transporter [Catellatospora coxensis]|uniref:MFS transporter n=1 Tax=Catellatospora coxensis TaxID=310354 RepID=A0A8J3L345_9ACTN|nr:MFS transporter [Catellatospora coxensis]GIG10514.1 MFS transporter [Catellatospora coxensis]
MEAAGLRMSSAAGRGTLAAAVLASGMAFLDSTVVNVALPTLGRELGASLAQLQWVINGYTLTLAAFVLLGGALGDRLGRRRIFVTGVVWFTLASLVCGIAPNVETLIAARVLQGVGGALLAPGSLALLQSSFQEQDRARAIGAWSGLAGATMALGPFIGGVLIDQVSWRWIFLINVPLAAVIVWLSRRYVPESRDSAVAHHFDVAGAALGAAALGGVTYGLIAWPEHGFVSLPVLGAFVVGLAGAIGFLLVERARAAAAMMPLRLFSSRVFSVLNLYTVLTYGAFGGFFFLLVIYLQTGLGYDALEAGLATLPMTLLMLVGSELSGAMATKFGPRLQLTLGPLFCAAGVLMIRTMTPGVSYWTGILPGVLVFGLGLTLLVAPLTATVLSAVDVRFAGVASGVNNTAARAGSLLAVAALPLVVGLSGEDYENAAALGAAFYQSGMWCAAVFVLASVLALFVCGGVRLDRPGRAPTPAQRTGHLPQVLQRGRCP